MPKKMTKNQLVVLTKAFQLLRAGALEGERLTKVAFLENENLEASKALLEHVSATVRVVQEIETALQMHIGADSLLANITELRMRPPSKAPVGRPRSNLRLLPGGK